jgi:hypothetical protein
LEIYAGGVTTHQEAVGIQHKNDKEWVYEFQTESNLKSVNFTIVGHVGGEDKQSTTRSQRHREVKATETFPESLNP